MSSSPDPVAALRDAWSRTRESLSFTSIRGREVTSAHNLHIGGYSTINKIYKHGKGVESKPFRAGGHRWKLTYYPNGYADSTTGRPSVVLSLMENRFFGRAANATAAHSFSVLDCDGKQLDSQRLQPHNFSLHDRSSGSKAIWTDVMDDTTAEKTMEVLGRLKDDSLVVRCEVRVQKSEMESGLRWFLRRYLD